MSGVFIKDETLKNIADAIRKKTRTDTAMHPSEMPFRIQSYLGQLTFEGGGRFYPDKYEDLSHKYEDSILKMSPVCGPNVTNMYYTYYNCHNLTGSPVCGPNVTNMSFTYGYCNNLTGSPVCGPNVTNMTCTYTNCHNLTGSPVCGPNVTNMSFTYDNCHNLTGSPVCGPNVTNMYYTYFNCYNLTGSPVCGPNVTNMTYAYANCHNLPGSPVCGPNVTNMSYTYANCHNLTGSPVCGQKVTKMFFTYANCHSLTGYPACGPNVTNMYYTYLNCYNLTGSPVCGPNVTNMYRTYFNCRNLTGYPVYGNSAIDMNEAYLLTNLDHSYVFFYLNFNNFNSIISYPELGIEPNMKLENYVNSINIITTNLYDYYNQQEFTKFTNIFTYSFIYKFFGNYIAHDRGNLGSRHAYENYDDAEKININNFTYFDGNEYVTKNVRYVICVSCNYYGDSRDTNLGNTQINIGFFEPLD